MSHRQLVLDTETTGLKPEDGHRIIEIACVELLNRKITGDYFHCYLNPERDIDQGAQNIHGLTLSFLQDKERFADVATRFLNFIQGAELIIHNAPFDTGFLNHELALISKEKKTILDYCAVIDTLQMAREKHAGQRNNLDALCKRYKIDNSKRELHGALLDANLLAQVYLAMTGGQGDFFGEMEVSAGVVSQEATQSLLSRPFHLILSSLTEEEKVAHEHYLTLLAAKGNALWR